MISFIRDNVLKILGSVILASVALSFIWPIATYGALVFGTIAGTIIIWMD